MAQISLLQAGLAWPFLVSAAGARSTRTYREIATIVQTRPIAVRFALEHIARACDERDAPPLSALVVSSIDGKQGKGFHGGRDQETIEKVYTYDWSSIANPFPVISETQVSTFVASLFDHPETAGDIYRATRQRGAWQAVFRAAVLRAYDGRCAFCGLGFTEALEAAHLRPWSELAEEHRAHPKSGILLCSNHHRLFDAQILWIDADLRIQFRDPTEQDGGYLLVDSQTTTSLNNQEIRLPDDPRWHPDPALLGILT